MTELGVVAEALALTCSTCHAGPGVGCRTRLDRPCGPHVERYRAATARRVQRAAATVPSATAAATASLPTERPATPLVDVCGSCGAPINPATGECRCSS